MSVAAAATNVAVSFSAQLWRRQQQQQQLSDISAPDVFASQVMKETGYYVTLTFSDVITQTHSSSSRADADGGIGARSRANIGLSKQK